MSYALTILAVFALAGLGMACLAVTQASHWSALMHRPMPARASVRLIRVAGIAAMMASLVVASAVDGPGFGSILWAFSLSMAGACIAAAIALVQARSRRDRK